MRNLFVITVGVFLASVSLTFAQGSKKSNTEQAPAAATGVPQAPIGHLQPRRDAVPPPADNGYQESAEDRELNRKIKSICRGC